VVSVIPVGKRTVNCIQVEGSLYLAGKDLVLTHNSMTTNVFWPAWEWGPKGLSHYRYLSFSHEKSLATRDNVRCRDLMKQEWYQSLWGDDIIFRSDQDGKEHYGNTLTGWRRSSAADSLIGHRGDRVIGDDVHTVKGAESEVQREDVLQTVAEVVPTRLNKPQYSAIVYIMQRTAERDASGFLIAERLGYTHLMLPMEFEKERRCYSIVKPSYIKNPKKRKVYYSDQERLWGVNKPEGQKEILESHMYNVDWRKDDGELLDPERFPAEVVEELKQALRSWGGDYAVAGQLQQRPAPREGGMFKKEDFIIIDSLGQQTGNVVRGWDLAASTRKKSPYSVGVKMMKTYDGKIIVLDVNRFRKEPGFMEEEINRTANVDGKNVFISLPQDPGQAGKAQKSSFARFLHGFTPHTSPESGSKEGRAEPFAAQVALGNVYLLRGSWNNAYINELALGFASQFLDQIDASSRAYAYLLTKKVRKVPSAPEVITI
jgi:predicted phage terminase large subunit-like protein